MASMASCAPCHKGRPLTRTSIARASLGGEGRFMSRRNMLVRTRPPASRQILATARSKGMERARRNPDVAQAARWSPNTSRAWPQLQRWGVKGRGRRRRRKRQTRKCSGERVYSGVVGYIHCEGTTRIGASLGEQERARGRVQVREERGELDAVLGCAGEALPPAVVIATLAGEWLGGAWQGKGVPCRGLEAVGPKGVCSLGGLHDKGREGTHFPAQEVQDSVRSCWQPSMDGGEGVCPRGPVRCLSACMG